MGSRKLKILAVDDLQDNLITVKALVSEVFPNTEVLTALSGRKALELAAAEDPDVILLDILMPEMDGFEVCRRLKADKQLADIPVVFVTAMTEDKENRIRAIECGGEAFLNKPIDLSELISQIRAMIKIKTANNEKKDEKVRLVALVEEQTRELQQSQAATLQLLNNLQIENETRKAREESLRKSEEDLNRSRNEYLHLATELQNILDTIPDSITFLSPDMSVLWRNKFSSPALDLAAKEAINEHCYNQLTRKGERCEDCPALQSLRTGEPAIKSLSFPDGRTLEVRTIAIKEGDRIVKLVVINRDITAHRQLEEQLRQSQKMESVGTLASGIAHDFNNILAAISGYGQLTLMKLPTDDPLRNNVSSILESVDRATHLTKELLIFSRKQTSTKRLLNVNEIAIKTEKFLKRIIAEDILFSLVLHEKEIPVMADAHQFEQVLINLATNACHSMPQGGKLTLSTEMIVLKNEFPAVHGSGPPGTYALVTVSDTGTGMDVLTQKRIFEPFFTTKEAGKGTGLGLAVVYGIIKGHNGYIKVYSVPGMGSTFQIYLPIVFEKIRPEILMPEGMNVGGAETILLAEDDEMVRTITTKILTEFGYTVITATDGTDAVHKFREQNGLIDLLLFDLIMPKMNGKEAFDEIRKIRPGIKAVFSSGYAPETVRQKTSLAEGTCIITKPTSPEELLRTIRQVLDNSL